MSALPFSRTDTNSLHVHQKRDIQKRDTANARTPFRTGIRTERFPEKFAIRLDLYRCRSQSERCYLPGRYDPNALWRQLIRSAYLFPYSILYPRRQKGYAGNTSGTATGWKGLDRGYYWRRYDAWTKPFACQRIERCLRRRGYLPCVRTRYHRYIGQLRFEGTHHWLC